MPGLTSEMRPKQEYSCSFALDNLLCLYDIALLEYSIQLHTGVGRGNKE